jgi:hypothetical protein
LKTCFSISIGGFFSYTKISHFWVLCNCWPDFQNYVFWRLLWDFSLKQRPLLLFYKGKNW